VRMVAMGTEIQPAELIHVARQAVGSGSTLKGLLVGRLGLLAEMTLPRGVITSPTRTVTRACATS
jgi:hypothetical protein